MCCGGEVSGTRITERLFIFFRLGDLLSNMRGHQLSSFLGTNSLSWAFSPLTPTLGSPHLLAGTFRRGWGVWDQGETHPQRDTLSPLSWSLRVWYPSCHSSRCRVGSPSCPWPAERGQRGPGSLAVGER